MSKALEQKYIEALPQAISNLREWEMRVHDMPNSDYQSGLRWFRDAVRIAQQAQKEVIDGKTNAVQRIDNRQRDGKGDKAY